MYKQLIKMYEEGASLRALGEKFGKSHSTIKRILDRLGVEIRDSSKAQANYLKNNPDKHPTKGKPRPEDVRLKISKTYDKYLEPAEIKRRQVLAKKTWEAKTPEEKAAVREKTFTAFRSTAKYGSSLEKFVLSNLSAQGFQPEFHRETLIENVKMHIDIFLPEHNVAIEIDGPTHYEPIFGQERLEKTQFADTEKNGLLISNGMTVIRVRQKSSSLTKYNKHMLVENLIKEIQRKPVKELIRLEI